jgi:dTDP-glucose pyrophosphorylase
VQDKGFRPLCDFRVEIKTHLIHNIYQTKNRVVHFIEVLKKSARRFIAITSGQRESVDWKRVVVQLRLGGIFKASVSTVNDLGVITKWHRCITRCFVWVLVAGKGN